MDGVTISNLIAADKLLEIGCHICKLHLYLRPTDIAVSPETPVPAVSELLRCIQCGAVNAEANYPVWVRPDARPPRMGSG